MKKRKKIVIIVQVILFMLIIANMLFIFFMSAETGEKSSKRSDSITEEIAPIIIKDYEKMDATEKDNVHHNLGFFIRKTAHMAEYASLSFLCTALLLTLTNKMYITLVIPVSFSFLYAMTDELLHQRFIDGRVGHFSDVLIDTAGALIGELIMLTIYLLIKKVNAKKARNISNANNEI